MIDTVNQHYQFHIRWRVETTDRTNLKLRLKYPFSTEAVQVLVWRQCLLCNQFFDRQKQWFQRGTSVDHFGRSIGVPSNAGKLGTYGVTEWCDSTLAHMPVETQVGSWGCIQLFKWQGHFLKMFYSSYRLAWSFRDGVGPTSWHTTEEQTTGSSVQMH